MNGTCGWPTETGSCRRPYRPEGCGMHPAPLNPADAVLQTCRCERSFIQRDQGEQRCLKCGKPQKAT